MKKLLYTMLAATLCFAACRKQQTVTPASTNGGQITDADFNDSKATVAGLHMKKSGDGIEFDYDLVIKEVSDDKYEAGIKIYGLKVDGKEAKDAGKMAIFGVVLGLNTTKESKETPLSIELAVKDIKELANGKIISFPAFSYKGNLAYELVDVRSTISVSSDNIKVYDRSTFSFGSVYFTLLDPKIDLSKTSWTIAEGITGASAMGKSEGHEKTSPSITYTNFALFYSCEKGSERCDVVESNTIFILPKGHTIKQAPELAKVTTEDLGKETYGYVTLVVTGDPDRAVSNVQYRPEPVSANDPKDPKAMIKLPVMDFKETHFNQKNGVRRFVSTQTWDEVYGKTPIKNKPTIAHYNVYHLCYEHELTF